jgi:hypothetical protein
MNTNQSAVDLQYLDPSRVNIGSTSCTGMTIRAATGGVLGTLQGFLIDPIARQLRYLVVRTLEQTTFLPFGQARVDPERREIEVRMDENERLQLDIHPAIVPVA